jgi:hypothetical protein
LSYRLIAETSERPKTNVMSDKDRIATTRPQVDPKELRKLSPAATRRSEGHAGSAAGQQLHHARTGPGQAPAQQAQQQPPQPPQPQQSSPSNQIAQLQLPQTQEKPPVKFGGTLSAGSAIDQAARAAAQNRGGYGGQGGDFGLSQGKAGGVMGPMEILTDTMGVDFGPYLNRVLQDVRQNWYQLIPESAS